MLHYLLVLLTMQPLFIAVLLSLHRILPVRHPGAFCALTAATMDLLWLWGVCSETQVMILLNILILATGFLYLPFFADREQRLLSFFVLAMLLSLTLVLLNTLEHLLFALAPHLGIELKDLADPASSAFFLRTLGADLLVVPVVFLLAAAMGTSRSTMSETRGLLWFLAIPFSQAVLLDMINQKLSYPNDFYGWIPVIAGGILCISADFACILGYRKIIELQLIANQVQQAEDQLKIQSSYYHEMQGNILRVNRIRHDLNNQLKTAYYLLEQGHPEEVRRQLDTLQSCIQDHIGTRYCENMVVDAILSEKAAQCSNLGIPLQLSVLVPADLKIDSSHLCSTFSNLLDNCIAAALKAGKNSGPIILRSDIHKGYLTIACSNPSVEPRKEPKTDILRRHGLGLEILGRLAVLHDGSFDTSYRDGRFYVNMRLKNE